MALLWNLLNEVAPLATELLKQDAGGVTSQLMDETDLGVKEEPGSPFSCSFSPLQRSRCNTWPRVLQESRTAAAVHPETATSSTPLTGLYAAGSQSSPLQQALPLVSEEGHSEDETDIEMGASGGNLCKFRMSSRRNPWGNYSYADLITQAIQSSPEQRLTLAQIYDWMVSSVPYFKERSDVNSSAGWKNSIRHNLSLHQKFVKVQNDGAGKSSWWTLSKDSKQPPRTPRRRAASMETNRFRREREKAREKLKMLRGGRLERAASTNTLYSPPATLYSPPTGSLCSPPNHSSTGKLYSSSQHPPSPTSLLHRSLDFRPRASSTASSESSFRVRSASDASPPRLVSSPSPLLADSSPPSLMDFTLADFPDRPDPRTENDLDNIKLDDLNIIEPANIIRQYLHPAPGRLSADRQPNRTRHPTSLAEPIKGLMYSGGGAGLEAVNNGGYSVQSRPVHHKLTILEPREASQGIQQSVIQYCPHKVTQYNQACLEGRLSAFPHEGPLQVDEELARENDQRRRELIALRLNQLQARQNEVTSSFAYSTSKISEASRHNLDMQIKLLQDEMSKIDRQEEEYRLRKELACLEDSCVAMPRHEADGRHVSRRDADGRDVGRHDLLSSPTAEQTAARAGMAELEQCLKLMKEEEDEKVVKKEEVEATSLAEELASLESMDIVTENKIDLDCVEALQNILDADIRSYPLDFSEIEAFSADSDNNIDRYRAELSGRQQQQDQQQHQHQHQHQQQHQQQEQHHQPQSYSSSYQLDLKHSVGRLPTSFLFINS